VFVRGSDTLIRASPFLIEREPLREICYELSAKAALRHEVVVADLSVSIVEMCTSGEIVEARKPFTAETAENALLVAKDWINDSQHNATSFRVVDPEGKAIFDALVTDFDMP
jgi:hypothetical protein